MLHILMRKPADVIVEDGLHPNPGPRRLPLPEAKRMRTTDADEEGQPQIQEIEDGEKEQLHNRDTDDGSTLGYYKQGIHTQEKKG